MPELKCGYGHTMRVGTDKWINRLSLATRGMEHPMTIQFLSHEEVCELTDARTKAGQILKWR